MYTCTMFLSRMDVAQYIAVPYCYSITEMNPVYLKIIASNIY